MSIRDRLFALRDAKYRDFQAKLIPNVPAESFIGVRTPELRRLAKELKGTPEAEAFLHVLPHQSYDENNLHAFLVSEIRDYENCLAELERFLPYVDNWATCDQMRPKCFGKHLPELRGEIRRWIGSGETYTVRFGIEMLMGFYLDEEFCPEDLALVASVRSEEYYVKMMVAWYFATALAKQYDAVLPYLEQRRMDTWCHNKTVQKAIESNRISNEQKAYLRTLKIRGTEN